jgi:hypothetical protein
MFYFHFTCSFIRLFFFTPCYQPHNVVRFLYLKVHTSFLSFKIKSLTYLSVLSLKSISLTGSSWLLINLHKNWIGMLGGTIAMLLWFDPCTLEFCLQLSNHPEFFVHLNTFSHSHRNLGIHGASLKLSQAH